MLLVLFLGSISQCDIAKADCAILPFRTVEPMVERFLFNPRTLLNDFPAGGNGLVSSAADIAMSSNTALPGIITMARAASVRQRGDIAKGLAIAAQRCKTTQPVTARAIEVAVKKVPDNSFVSQFTEGFKSSDTLQADQEDQRRAQALKEQMITNETPDPLRNPLSQAISGRSSPFLPVNPITAVRPIQPISPMQ